MNFSRRLTILEPGFTMMRHFQILLSLTLLLGLGCRKPEEPTHYVNQEMMRYCWFPAGSYWIYEEDSTPGRMDSVYVTNTFTSILPDYGEGYQMESYGNGLVMNGDSFAQSRTAWRSGSEGSVTIMEQGRSDLAGPYSDAVFFWDFDGATTLSYHPSTRIVGRYDSITVRNIVYHDAIEVKIDPPQAAYYQYQTVFVRNIGVVHRSMTDGTNWSLVRYRIGG